MICRPCVTWLVLFAFLNTGFAQDELSKYEVAVLRGFESPVVSVAISPDGKTLATAEKKGAAKLWDLKTGTPTRVLENREAVEFAADGSLVITVSASEYTDRERKQDNILPLAGGKTLPTGDKVITIWPLKGEAFLPMRLYGLEKEGNRVSKSDGREIIVGKVPESWWRPSRISVALDGKSLAVTRSGGADFWALSNVTNTGIVRTISAFPTPGSTLAYDVALRGSRMAVHSSCNNG